jgi:hypothetical protein
MYLVTQILPWLAAISAFAAAALWFKSSIVTRPAPAGTHGVGALLGGAVVVQDAHGNRVDVAGTMQDQSSWNKWAAVAAGVSAILAGVIILTTPSPCDCLKPPTQAPVSNP